MLMSVKLQKWQLAWRQVFFDLGRILGACLLKSFFLELGVINQEVKESV